MEYVPAVSPSSRERAPTRVSPAIRPSAVKLKSGSGSPYVFCKSSAVTATDFLVILNLVDIVASPRVRVAVYVSALTASATVSPLLFL